LVEGEETYLALKFPKQCPLVLAKIRLRVDKDLRSENGNKLGCGAKD
jgi:hypothetical protein